MRIGFRTTKQADPAEHWMNRLSVSWTRRRGDIEPGGSICHAEIMLQVRPGEWRRWSIAKKTFTRGADGVKRWIPGRVHCKPVDVMNDDYVYIKIFMNRKSQTNMYEFLMSQVGGGFNMTGYTLNFMVPCGGASARRGGRPSAGRALTAPPRAGFGTRRYFPGIEQRRRRVPHGAPGPCEPNAVLRRLRIPRPV